MSTSRRGLLKVGLAGGALLAVGGIGLGLWPGSQQTPAGPLQALSPRAYSILWAVAETMCPGGDGLPAASALGVAAGVDATMATLHPGDVLDFERALMLLENALAGALLDGRARPFSSASVDARVATLEGWRTSGMAVKNQAYKAIRGLVMAAYWGHPQLYAAAGYPGPPDFGQSSAGDDDLQALAAEGRARMAGVDVAEGTAPPPTPGDETQDGTAVQESP